MLTKTKNAMNKHALTLPPSSERAQCYTIANYNVAGSSDKTIAGCFIDDHRNLTTALRHARLCVAAGCAEEINVKPGFFGDIVFEDGSRLDSSRWVY